MSSTRKWFLIGSGGVLWLAAVAAWAGFMPGGIPFLANTDTQGSQRQPDVAFDGTGRALVVWDSDENGPEDIAGRIINPDGAPTGSDLDINTSTADHQIRPAVAGLPGGGFVVVWESYVLETEEDELNVQRLDSTGNLVGGEINIDDSEFHLHADVAATTGGGFVVVWDDGLDIFGRRFNSNGSPIGDEFFVNSELGTMYGPRVAGDDDGGFLVVWEDQSEIDGDGAGVFMRRFDSDGEALTDDVQVNSTTEGDQYAPAVAMQAGAFVVVWETYGQSGPGDGAFARLFTNSGVPLGTDFRVDSGETAYAGYVDVTAVDDDEFAIVWNEPRDEGGAVLKTLLRRFDAGGVGGEIIEVGDGDDSEQANGVVAGRGDDLIVAWEGIGPDERDIFAQVFEALPSPTAGPGSCIGDCNGDGSVSIAELIRAVNISLGQAPIQNCSAADRNSDGSISISELIASVNSSLNGCP